MPAVRTGKQVAVPVAAGKVGGDAVAGNGRRGQVQLPVLALAGKPLPGQVGRRPGLPAAWIAVIELVALVQRQVLDRRAEARRGSWRRGSTS
jgi:hypothetical protein